MILGVAAGERSRSLRTGEEFCPLPRIAGAFSSDDREEKQAVAGD